MTWLIGKKQSSHTACNNLHRWAYCASTSVGLTAVYNCAHCTLNNSRRSAAGDARYNRTRIRESSGQGLGTTWWQPHPLGTFLGASGTQCFLPSSPQPVSGPQTGGALQDDKSPEEQSKTVPPVLFYSDWLRIDVGGQLKVPKAHGPGD